MSDENTPDGAADADEHEDSRKTKDIVQSRDKWKSKARAAAEELEILRAEKDSARQQKMLEEKRFQELLEEEKGRSAAYKAEKEKAEKAWEGKYKTLVHEIRFDKYAGALASKLGSDRTVVEALLLKAGKDGGLDMAPEQISAETVDAGAEVLKKLAPSLFTNRGNSAGGAPYMPMHNPQIKAPGEADLESRRAAIREKAKRDSEKLYSK